jgi:very-short-patch-repair endonuclease
MCRTPSPAVHTFGELRAMGLTRAAIDTQHRIGRITRIRRGVYADEGCCDNVRSAAAHGGSLACLSAARHIGLWTLTTDSDLHVWMRGHGHPRDARTDGGVEHWDIGRTTDAFGLPSVPRILRQIYRCYGVEDFFVALESALRQEMLDSDGRRWLHEHTNEIAREALALARSDADSGLESLLRWRLRRFDLRVRTQARIFSVGVVDILIGDALLIEADGVENHDAPAQRHKDLVRDAHAAGWGYVTLRFDYALIVHDWDLVERAIVGQITAGHHMRWSRHV